MKKDKKETLCYWCGCKITPQNYTIDHLVAKNRGGDERPENKVVCCNDCNQDKKSKTTFRGVNLYKLVGIEKPLYISLQEEIIKRLKRNNNFCKWYNTLDAGNQEYFDNTVINVLRDI